MRPSVTVPHITIVKRGTVKGYWMPRK